jgi:hypothetical protein
MSDLMFYGVLEMPYEMAMSDEISRIHFYGRAQQAADRLQAAEREVAELRAALASQGVAVPAVRDLIFRSRTANLLHLIEFYPNIAKSDEAQARKAISDLNRMLAAAPQPPAVKETELAPAEIENAATLDQWRAADQAAPCDICDDTRTAFGKRCVCAGAEAGGPP